MLTAPVNVLLIEDNRGDALLVKEALRSVQSKTIVQLEWVEYLQEGLDRLASNHIQAVLLDLSLPDSIGLDTLEQVLSHSPQIPVIVMTGLMDEEVGVQALEAGAQDYLIKGQVDGRLLLRSIQYGIKRKQTEIQLAEALAFTEQIFSSSPVGILTYKFTGECVSANAYVAELVGTTVDVLQRQNFRELESWKKSGLYDLAEQAIASGQPSASDIHLISTFGKESWLGVQFVTFRSAGEEHLLLIIADITERKKAEEAVLESERQMQALVTSLDDIVFEFDEQGTYLNVWAADESLLALPKAQLLGRRIEEVLGEKHGRPFVEAVKRVLASGRPESIEYPLEVIGGQRWFLARISPILFQNKISPTVSTLVRDITERKRAEQALRESETRFRSLIENSSDEVSIVNADGQLLYESPTANPTLGYQPGEFLGQDLFQLIHPEDSERVRDQFARLLQDPNLHPREQFRLRHRTGDWRWVEAVGTNLLSEPSVHGIVVNYHDVTDRVRVEREIRQRTEDLLLINTLNDAANRGDDLERIVEAFAREARTTFDCHDVAIYLLTTDGKYIEMQNSTLPYKVTEKIEKLIGHPIPKIQVPLREDGYFKKIMANEEGLITNDPKVIQQWIEEFTETTFLPQIMRPAVRKLIPQIYKALNISSTISIPLISSGRAIGILDMSSEGQFNEEDLQRIRSISYQITAVMMRKQAEKQVQLQLKRLSALSEIDRAITSTLDMRLSLDVLLSEVLSQLVVDAAAVLLLNESNLMLEYYAGKGFRSLAVRQSRMRLGEGLAGQVGMERRLLHLSNLAGAGSQIARTGLFKEEGFVEYFGVPLVAKGMLKGVLEIFHRTPLYPDIEWTNYLETLGGQAAIAIDNAQLFESMQKSNLEMVAAYDATIAGWSHAMDLRDKETEGHTLRVTELTLKLAEKMGFGQQEQVHIRRGALLHDIGKIGVPDQILLKPGKLSEEEWAVMRQHPSFAFEMLSPISYLRPALDIPYCHHEKWDGTGYPRGLKGEQIPLAARIFAVIDVWDALTSDRPYRKAWSTKKTLNYIKEETGKYFDPTVVEAFLKLIAES